MPRKSFTPEQIIAKLRQIEVLISQGQSVAGGCRAAEISEQSYYRWRKEYGGMGVTQAKQLKELKKENQQLKGWWRIWLWTRRCSKRSPGETSKP